MRNQAAREIVLFILEHDLCTFSEILEHMKKAPSTVSWHLKRLSDAGIVLVTYGQNFHLYRVTNSKFIGYVLDKYKESFRDKVANQYYEIFGDL
jgi:DNA-binding transcriptional ArsR family regulator